ncbi:FadR family transcriptional regulator [Microvirga sp. BT689]|uniref:FadR/GntR family transcriptional regulator n=1 Tax=Microvirga arvi TaxID=2778731 RepID=UPI001950DF3B|nr:FadR/GntR family transcriptional regulator [Microvirga arvi]MBM6581268.1 FadR family transcriptional regulator [Microvirga arvi]
MVQGSKPGKIGAVVSGLGSEIIRGAFLPGQALPPEHELEARFGASRGVIREAIKMLAAKGLISVRPRFGTHVKPRHDWSLLDRELLGWLAGDQGLDRTLLLAFEETRAIIEPAAAALAARRAEPEDVRRIMAALDAMEHGRSDRAAAIAADKDFHLSILEATHNPVLRSFRGAIDAILSAVFDVAVEAFEGNLGNHAAVAHAIARGDADEAQRSMEQLLGYTLHHLSPASDKTNKIVRNNTNPRENRHDVQENPRVRGSGRRDKPARSGGVA